MLCEMQSFSSRTWTRVAVSISYDDNHYTTGTSFWLIPLERLWTPLYPLSNRFDSITAVKLQRCLWNKITHEGWYFIIFMCVCMCVYVSVCINYKKYTPTNFLHEKFIISDLKILGFYFINWNIIQSKRLLLAIIYYQTLQHWHSVTKNMNI